MLSVIDIVKNKKSFTLNVDGQNMMPLLYPGDVLSLKKTSFNSTKANDIILVNKRGKNFIHRVIYKNDKFLVTKGDNNSQSDGKIYPKNIMAKLINLKRNGRDLNVDTLYLFQSTLYFQEIIRVTKNLYKEKINFVFLKGLPVHLFYERKHPSRIYVDSDILIEKKYLAKVEDILKRLSYQPLEKKKGFL